MRKKHKNLVILATVLSAACLLSACGKDKEDQVVVAEAPTPTPTAAPSATPIPSVTATAQKVAYTSKDGKVSIQLPDSSWKNTSDSGDSIIFNSETLGNITIVHADTDADLAKIQVPSTKELAGSITAGTGLTEGTDFDILDYQAAEMEEVDVYRYTVKAADPSKMNGFAYTENYYLTNGTELYQICGSLKLQDPTSLNTMKEAVTSFRILDAQSPLKAAADSVAAQNSSSAAATITPSVTPAADSSSGEDSDSGSSSDNSASDTGESYSYEDSSSSDGDSGNGSSNQSSEDGWYDGDTFISYDDGYFDDDGYWHWYGDESDDDSGSGSSSDDGSGSSSGGGSDDNGWYDENGNYFSYDDGYFDDDGVWQWY